MEKLTRRDFLKYAGKLVIVGGIIYLLKPRLSPGTPEIIAESSAGNPLLGNLDNIEKLLKGRIIIDAYRAEGIDNVEGLRKALEGVGFTSDDPIDEFFRLNDGMCMEVIKRIPIYGECDFCKGYKGIPQCQKWFGALGCAVTKVIPDKEMMYQSIFTKMRAGIVDILYKSPAVAITDSEWDDKRRDFLKEGTDADGNYWYCTKGHGFYCKPFEASLGKPPFDITWR